MENIRLMKSRGQHLKFLPNLPDVAKKIKAAKKNPGIEKHACQD